MNQPATPTSRLPETDFFLYAVNYPPTHECVYGGQEDNDYITLGR